MDQVKKAMVILPNRSYNNVLAVVCKLLSALPSPCFNICAIEVEYYYFVELTAFLLKRHNKSIHNMVLTNIPSVGRQIDLQRRVLDGAALHAARWRWRWRARTYTSNQHILDYFFILYISNYIKYMRIVEVLSISMLLFFHWCWSPMVLWW